MINKKINKSLNLLVIFILFLNMITPITNIYADNIKDDINTNNNEKI